MEKQAVLVGDTGFVGSNLCESHAFASAVHSVNVNEMYGLHPEILVYAGVTGTKWYANRHPKEDRKIMLAACGNIKRISPKKLVLISTVDVYDAIRNVDEHFGTDKEKLHVYGRHRAELEDWVRENTADFHIVRLPAIYGKNLKKNFLYDLIHLVPKVLPSGLMREVQKSMPDVGAFYETDRNMDYVRKELNKEQYAALRRVFEKSSVNALDFTNCESEFQFYNLKYLWGHLEKIIEYGIEEINLVTEPVSAGEIYRNVYGGAYGKKSAPSIRYDIRTLYAGMLEGRKDYLFDREFVINDVTEFVRDAIAQLTI